MKEVIAQIYIAVIRHCLVGNLAARQSFFSHSPKANGQSHQKQIMHLRYCARQPTFQCSHCLEAKQPSAPIVTASFWGNQPQPSCLLGGIVPCGNEDNILTDKNVGVYRMKGKYVELYRMKGACSAGA